MIAFYQKADAMLARTPISLVSLVLRVALAIPFLRSGMTKWDGFFELSPATVYLFSQEFKLHLFGAVFPYPFPVVMAWASALGEIVLPVLLIAGLFTRFSALGILVMTAVIQLTVPDGWASFHLPWAAMAIALVATGGARVALDAALGSIRVRRESYPQ